MSSVLGVGVASASRASVSSAASDEPSAVAEGIETPAKETSEKPEAEVKMRSERIGRPERVERNEKGGKKFREKAYKCTKPGCTKVGYTHCFNWNWSTCAYAAFNPVFQSYLNPNGLKYHLAKGTCTFADGSTPSTPVSPITPSMPTGTVDNNTPAQATASNSSNNQPVTQFTPSSPHVYSNGNVNMYEYRQHQQAVNGVPIISAPAPPPMHVFAPGMAQAC